MAEDSATSTQQSLAVYTYTVPSVSKARSDAQYLLCMQYTVHALIPVPVGTANENDVLS